MLRGRFAAISRKRCEITPCGRLYAWRQPSTHLKGPKKLFLVKTMLEDVLLDANSINMYSNEKLNPKSYRDLIESFNSGKT